MKPIVDGIEEKYGAEIVVKRINANQGTGPEIMRTHRILGHPTTLIFDRHGQEIERFIGPQPAATIETTLHPLLN